jgi:hypothetical protein
MLTVHELEVLKPPARIAANQSRAISSSPIAG